jgi:hypothetical protein
MCTYYYLTFLFWLGCIGHNTCFIFTCQWTNVALLKRLCVCGFVCVYVSVCMSVCLPLCLVCHSVCLCICLCGCEHVVSVSLFMSASLCLCTCLHLSLSMCGCLCACWSILCLSLCVSVCACVRAHSTTAADTRTSIYIRTLVLIFNNYFIFCYSPSSD